MRKLILFTFVMFLFIGCDEYTNPSKTAVIHTDNEIPYELEEFIKVYGYNMCEITIKRVTLENHDYWLTIGDINLKGNSVDLVHSESCKTCHPELKKISEHYDSLYNK